MAAGRIEEVPAAGSQSRAEWLTQPSGITDQRGSVESSRPTGWRAAPLRFIGRHHSAARAAAAARRDAHH